MASLLLSGSRVKPTAPLFNLSLLLFFFIKIVGFSALDDTYVGMGRPGPPLPTTGGGVGGGSLLTPASSLLRFISDISYILIKLWRLNSTYELKVLPSRALYPPLIDFGD